MTIQKLNGLSDLIDQFDVVLFDAWGVLHDGEKAYPHVVDTLQKLREAGKKSVVVSNSPRLQNSVSDTLSRNGIPKSAYDFLHSSGQEGLCVFNEAHTFGQKCFHYGDESHRPFFEQTQLERVERLEDADFILNTGFLHDEGGRDTSFIEKSISLGLKMVCLNPDVTVLIAGVSKLCAGYYASLYKKAGGEVSYIGKPYPEIYQRAMKQAGIEEGARALIIGDSFETDLKGGQNANIPTVLTLTGIHHLDLIKDGSLNEEGLNQLVDQYGYGPNYVIDQVRF